MILSVELSLIIFQYSTLSACSVSCSRSHRSPPVCAFLTGVVHHSTRQLMPLLKLSRRLHLAVHGREEMDENNVINMRINHPVKP